MSYFVNVYEVSRAYGGPEEGGWWYDCGTALESWEYATLDEAKAAAADAREDYPDTGKRSSVLGGEDWDVRIQDHPAADYPEEMPRYE